MNLQTVTVALLCAACTSGEGDVGRQRPEQPSLAGSLLVTPILTIPDEDSNGLVQFEYAMGATRLGSGTIVVGDRYGASVRFFDSTGRLVSTSGRRGSGPGEFREVTWIGQCAPDEVYVWDMPQGRVSVFDHRGSFSHSYALPDRLDVGVGLISCHIDGHMALLTLPREFPRLALDGSSVRVRANLLLADSRGRVRHSLTDILAYENRPMGDVTTFGIGPSRVYVGPKDSARISVYSLSGEQLDPVWLNTATRRPTLEHQRRAVETLVAPSHSPSWREEWRERLMRTPMREALPPYHAIFIDSRGTLWVQTSIPGDPTTRLLAIGHDGRSMAEATIPGDLLICEIRDNHVLAILEDLDTGHQAIRLFALTTPNSTN